MSPRLAALGAAILWGALTAQVLFWRSMLHGIDEG